MKTSCLTTSVPAVHSVNAFVMLVSILGFLALTGNAAAIAHVYPDGYVDRSVSVVIRGNQMTLEYSAAMNDATIRHTLDGWKKGTAIQKMTTLVIESPVEPEATGQSADQIDSSAEAKNANTDQPEEDDFKNDAELLNELNQAAVQNLSKGLVVTIDGQPIQVPPSSTSHAPKHHMSVTAQFVVEFPASKPGEPKMIELKIVDKNYRQLGGEVRLALKATKGAMLNRTNVEPILVRAERVELADLDDEERMAAHTIEASVILPPSKPSSAEKSR